jgi:aryl-alcohol dehydrogenase-like predicted oxidoreductase
MTTSAAPGIPLGNTDLHVSALNLGGNVFGWNVDEPTSFAILDAYYERGGNFIDTADIYSEWVSGHSGGESERIIGRWIASRGLNGKVIVATKVGKPMGDGSRGLGREHVLRSAEASRERLQVDAIDLYYAHEDDQSVPLEETLGAFDELVRAGTVRALGASNYGAARLRDALEVSAANGFARYEVLQPEYNLVQRAEFERELQPLCIEFGISVAPYYSLASGFLTGKYRQDQPAPNSVRAQGVLRQYGTEAGWRVIATLDEIAAAHGSNPAQIALAWLAARASVATPIASATSLDQLEQIAGFAEIPLTSDQIAALDAASAEFA